MPNRKFWLYAPSSLIVLAAAGWVFYIYWYFPNNSGDGDLTLIKLPFSLSEESRAKIPNGFPYPYLTGTDIQVTSGGFSGNQYWVTTQTTDTVTALIAKYRDFFQKTNWTFVTDISAEQSATISVSKNGNQLAIAVTDLPSGGSFARLVYIGQAWITDGAQTP